jgi:hypothetical protein
VSDDEQVGARVPMPVFRIGFANATLLAGGYLVVGALVELARRLTNWRWTERVAWSMEAFPAGVLRSFGLLEPLRDAFVHGNLELTHVRVVYAATTVATVYVIGLVVACMLWLFTRRRRG